MSNISLVEPRSIIQGQTAQWQRFLPNYSVDTWSLNYVLLGPSRINVVCVTNGSAFEANVNTATTANWVPGHYQVFARVGDGTTVNPVDTAFPTVEIIANPDTADIPTDDIRSWARQTLEIVETAIKTLAAKTVATAIVNGTTYTLQDLDKLRAMRGTLRAEISAEEEAYSNNLGLPSRRLVYTRFSRPI